jgi:hypothetical protein
MSGDETDVQRAAEQVQQAQDTLSLSREHADRCDPEQTGKQVALVV